MGYYSREIVGTKFENSWQQAAEENIDPYRSRMLRKEPSLADVIIVAASFIALLVLAFGWHVAAHKSTAIRYENAGSFSSLECDGSSPYKSGQC